MSTSHFAYYFRFNRKNLLILFAALIAFTYQYNILGSALLYACLTLVSSYPLTVLVSNLLEEVTEGNCKKNCNCRISIQLNLKNILDSAKMHKIYQDLFNSKKINAVSFDIWHGQLLESFSLIHQNTPQFNSHRFSYDWRIDFTANSIYVNDRRVEGSNRLHLAIPFNQETLDSILSNGDKGRLLTPSNQFSGDTYFGVTVSVLIVNGEIKVQHTIDEGEPALERMYPGSARRYQTVTYFPIRLFPDECRLPISYLNPRPSSLSSKYLDHDSFGREVRQLNDELYEYATAMKSYELGLEFAKGNLYLLNMKEKRQHFLKQEDFHRKRDEIHRVDLWVNKYVTFSFQSILGCDDDSYSDFYIYMEHFSA